MKSPSVEPVKLPYASTVASFFGDQGATQGNSFLGRLFKGGGRPVIMNKAAAAAKPAQPNPMAALMNKALNGQGSDR